MVDVALHFRAAHEYARRIKKVGAIPTFFTEDLPPRPVVGLRLIPAGGGEVRDPLVSEMERAAESDFGARMRAASRYATVQTFAAGFPTFLRSSPGPRQRNGVVVLNSSVAFRDDVPALALGFPPIDDEGARFRAADAYARSKGWDGAYPNFFMSTSGVAARHGTVFLKPGTTEFENVPLADLNGASLDDPAKLMREATRWARARGWLAAVPTFNTALKGGFVCGLLVLDESAAELRDIPRRHLRGLDADPGAAIRDALEYATGGESGGTFVAGLPTFFRGRAADDSPTAGIVLLRPGAASVGDVPSEQLGSPDERDVPGLFRLANAWAARRKEKGAFPTLFRQRGRRAYGIATVHHHPGIRFDNVPAVVLYDDTYVRGDIRKKWIETGDGKGLGLPLHSERACADNVGRFSTFERGAVYWSPDHGAHTIGQAILDHWLSLGGENSHFGYPRTDEHDWNVPGQPPGRAVDFAHGTIGFRGGIVELPATIGPIVTSTETPKGSTLGGGVRFTMNAAGDYEFAFDMRTSGLTSYAFALNAAYHVPGRAALASGPVTGSVQWPGDPDWTFTVRGNSRSIRDHWPALARQEPPPSLTVMNNYEETGPVGVLIKAGRLVTDILATGVGATGGVVFWLGSGIGDLLPSLDIGGTFGIIAGVVVFAYGGGLALALPAGIGVGAVTNAMIRTRPLEGGEGVRLNRVFGGTLDTSRLRITNLAGLGGRAFCAKGLDGLTYLNLGSDEAVDAPTMYRDGDKHPAPGQLLVHEAVHAWQIEHGFYPEVFCDGIVNQTRHTLGADVYAFGPPETPWERFNAEQQASVVDRWFDRVSAPVKDPDSIWFRLESDPNFGAADPYFAHIAEFLRKPDR